MTVALADIVTALDAELRTAQIPDYPGAMNGLQVANTGRIAKIAVAVDASHAAIMQTVREGANLLIVHHGLFWSGAQPLVGVSYSKYQLLFTNDVAVYSSHLPLDLHPVYGNNVRLAEALSLTPSAGFAKFQSVNIGLMGTANESTEALLARVVAFAAQYESPVRTSISARGRTTRRWAMCSGGGASTDTLREARELGIDTLIVGEGPHHTTVDAIEHDLCVIYAGHYATETLGVQAMGQFLQAKLHVPWTFLHLPTGS